MSARSQAALRYAAAGAGLLWGAALLTRPRSIDTLLDDRSPAPVEVLLTRVLGARHVLEAIVLAGPSRRTRMPLLLTEATHAASMVALAAVSPRHRRMALASLLAAVTLGATTAIATKPVAR
jgi:hypothetical protein